ncbi:MAG: Beta-hexosaminidase [bacterium ADurb.Bin429]|nr:MAG: Beta-hexosaminidase [bacterium ADurb.Bin429]
MGPDVPREAYQLTCGETITLISADAAGLYYGVQTLAQLLYRDGAYPLGEVTDYPALPIRGFQFDLGRQIERMDYALEVCQRMSRLKANTVFLYVENGIRYESHPGFAAPGAWTMAETAEFIHRCATWHMDVIPIVPNLGHTHFIVRHPDYAHLNEGREGVRDSYGSAGNSLCPALPETRRLVEAMFAEWFAISPSPYFHISCDECHQLGLCSLCRPKYDAGGMAEVYLEHVNWAAELAVQAGKRPMLWGDQMLYWPERLPDLHSAVIIMDWEYHTRNGRSLNAFMHWRAEDTTGIFLRAGHEVVLAPYGASSHTAQFLNAYGRQPGVLGVNSTIWELSRTFFECEGTGIEFAAAGAWQGYAPDQAAFADGRAWMRFGSVGGDASALVDPCNSRHRGPVLSDLFSYITPLPKDALSRVPELARRVALTEMYAEETACDAERVRLTCETHLLTRELFSQRLREVMSQWYQALRHPQRTPPADTAARLRDLQYDLRNLRETEVALWVRYRPAEQTSSTLLAMHKLDEEIAAFLDHLAAGEPTGLERDMLVLHLTEPDPCFRRMTIKATDAEGAWQTIYQAYDGGSDPLRMKIFPLPAGLQADGTVRVTLQPHGEVGIRFLEILFADGRRAAPIAAEGEGFVRDAANVLTDDMRACWMNPDDVESTYLRHQHRPDLMGPNTLTVRMSDSPEYL